MKNSNTIYKLLINLLIVLRIVNINEIKIWVK